MEAVQLRYSLGRKGGNTPLDSLPAARYASAA
jgi:hypothetical protein